MEYHVFSFEQARLQYGTGNARNCGEERSYQAEQCLRSLIQSKGLPFELPIARTSKGKPFFPSMPKLHFNISHSKTHMAIAISDKPVGIDLEPIRRYKPALVRRVFHEEETAYLESLSALWQDEAFTRLWTLKEAYVKYTGTGIASSFPAFAVGLPSQPYPSIIRHITLSHCTETSIQPKLCSLYLPAINHYLALCTVE